MKECTMCALKKPDFKNCIFSDCPNGVNFVTCDCGEKIYNTDGKKLKCKKCNKHGGKRNNAGRKSQYKEETQTISFRVPKSLIEPITKHVKRALERKLKKKTKINYFDMNPNEKAKELFKKYEKELLDVHYRISGFVIRVLAINCSLIAVKEIISELESVEENITPHDFSGLLTYWDNVKKEIEKLCSQKQ